MNPLEFSGRAKRAVWIEHWARLVAIAGSIALLAPLFLLYEEVVSFGLTVYAVLASLAAIVLIGGYYGVLFSQSAKVGLTCASCNWKFLPGIKGWDVALLVVASKSCPSCGNIIVSEGDEHPPIK